MVLVSGDDHVAERSFAALRMTSSHVILSEAKDLYPGGVYPPSLLMTTPPPPLTTVPSSP
jgi:hypothetical protein